MYYKMLNSVRWTNHANNEFILHHRVQLHSTTLLNWRKANKIFPKLRKRSNWGLQINSKQVLISVSGRLICHQELVNGILADIHIKRCLLCIQSYTEFRPLFLIAGGTGTLFELSFSPQDFFLYITYKHTVSSLDFLKNNES